MALANLCVIFDFKKKQKKPHNCLWNILKSIVKYNLGDSLNYSNWGNNQPGSAWGFLKDEDCGSLNYRNRGRWYDSTCSEEFSYICEFGEILRVRKQK